MDKGNKKLSYLRFEIQDGKVLTDINGSTEEIIRGVVSAMHSDELIRDMMIHILSAAIHSGMESMKTLNETIEYAVPE